MSTKVAIAESPWERLLDQLKISGGGTLAGALVVPVVLSAWAPTGFVLGWAAIFVLQSIMFLGLVAFTGKRLAWRVWSTVIAAMFGAVCISVVLWGGDMPSAPWMAAAVTLAYISFEFASVPYLPLSGWFAGSPISAALLILMMFVMVGPLVALGFAFLLLSLGVLARRNRRLREDLGNELYVTNEKLLTDPLTGLFNRRGLEERLDELAGREVSIAVLDANRFKYINDTHGHVVGDKALVAIAEHLRESLTPDWVVSRYGGDEFVAIAEGDQSIDHHVVEIMAVELAEGEGSLNMSLSAGIASGTLNDNGDRLKSEAGHALRHAKRSGRKLVRSTGAMRQRFERSLAITAVDRAQLPIVPVVQPIVGLDGLVGAEMLARWRLDDGTLLEPAMFMDMLVEQGMLGQLDEMMVEHAVQLVAQFESVGHGLLVSANIAATHLLDAEISGRVERLLSDYRIDPSRLMLEVTESARLGDQSIWERSVAELRSLGIRLAIDDFGAGYSSIARLAYLPVTDLKLDRTLVQRSSGPMGEIVKGVTRFCDGSDIGVIAEGVETMDEFEAMRALGLTTFQGYLFGRPMRIEDFMRDLDGRSDGTDDQVLALIKQH